MREFVAEYNIANNRWGSGTGCKLLFTPNDIVFQSGAKFANCRIGSNGDPEWSGHSDRTGNPLVEILHEDHIYVGDTVTFAIEYAWRQWKLGDVSDDELKAGLTDLFRWIAIIGAEAPKSSFWNGVI